jgi:peptidoglycan/LPS O-acetylase OafA/YrhL
MPAERQTSALLRWAMLTGYLTYGFYLWHYVIIMTIATPLTSWASALTSIPWLATTIFHALELALALPLSYCFAWLSFVIIESRFRPGLYAGLSRPNSRSIDR